MKKAIIILSLMILNETGIAQSLRLHRKGIGPLVLKQVLDKDTGKTRPLEEHPMKNRILRTYTNLFSYFFWKQSSNQPLILNDSIRVNNFFFATSNRYGIVEDIVLYIPLEDINKAIIVISEVFGSAQLFSSSGAEGQTHRRSSFWQKDGVDLFLTQNIGAGMVEIHMRVFAFDEQPTPCISWY